MDRIIGIKNYESRIKGRYTIEILTTENQLARNIARQVEKAHKGAKAEVIWSKEESAARIAIRFQ
jgi:hypothetical protein